MLFSETMGFYSGYGIFRGIEAVRPAEHFCSYAVFAKPFGFAAVTNVVQELTKPFDRPSRQPWNRVPRASAQALNLPPLPQALESSRDHQPNIYREVWPVRSFNALLQAGLVFQPSDIGVMLKQLAQNHIQLGNDLLAQVSHLLAQVSHILAHVSHILSNSPDLQKVHDQRS